MKRIVSVLLVLTMVFALASASMAETKTANPVAGKKVAYVMLLPSATIFQMWKDSCADLCAALDVTFDFYFNDGDFNKWQDTIRTCASAGYDGLLVSHGNQDGSYVFLKEVRNSIPTWRSYALIRSSMPMASIKNSKASPSCSSRTRALSPFCWTRWLPNSARAFA